MSEQVTSLTLMPPSGVRQTIALHQLTNNAVFIWGSPGLAKSATGMKVATDRNVAFIDVRLSMYAPTDVLGMPYRVEENGETVGVAFTPPKILPRDLDENKVKQLQAAPTPISFKALNGVGSNKIHYIKKPTITATALDDDLTAEIVSQTPSSFIVQLVDNTGKLCAGAINYTITGKAEAIVAFEELNSAPLATQQAAYQFILDRRVGEYEVPDGVQLIAMGNLQTDKGLTYSQPLPLANRFIHVEMKMVFGEWQEWALESLVHPLVVGYLSNNKAALHDFKPGSASRGFQTPRSWEFVSNILHVMDKENAPEVKPTIVTANICGAIGDGEGVKFANFLKIHDKLPSIESIMIGQTKTLAREHKENVAVAFSLVTSLCYQLRLEDIDLASAGKGGKDKSPERDEWYRRFNHVMEFWLENMQPEVAVMGMRAIMTIHKLPIANRTLLPALKIFTENHHDLIVR